MRQAKLIKVETRLAREASQPGGLSVHDALRRADAALQTLAAPCLAEIDAALAQIETQFGPEAARRADEPFSELHELATRIIDSSIFLKQVDLDKAARALCQLVSRCKAQGVWDWVAVDLHIKALGLLRTVGGSIGQSEREAVLEGLKRLTEKRLGDADAPAT
jgi:hypothetical protein